MEIINFQPVRRNVPKKDEDLRRAVEIAKHFKVSPATVTRWTKREKNPLPSRKKGNVVLINFDVANEWFNGE